MRTYLFLNLMQHKHYPANVKSQRSSIELFPSSQPFSVGLYEVPVQNLPHQRTNSPSTHASNTPCRQCAGPPAQTLKAQANWLHKTSVQHQIFQATAFESETTSNSVEKAMHLSAIFWSTRITQSRSRAFSAPFGSKD